MLDYGKHSILGIGVNAIDYESAVDQIIAHAKAQRPMTVTALAVHGVMTGVFDREHHYRLTRIRRSLPTSSGAMCSYVLAALLIA